MTVTRRRFLTSSAAAALASTGIYGMIGSIATAPPRRSRWAVASGGSSRIAYADASFTLPPEQHLVLDATTVTNNGVVVTVPPLHHMIVTATLQVSGGIAGLQAAQALLEETISSMEMPGLLDFTPAGLCLAVAWGLPYFAQLPPNATQNLPIDLRASAAFGKEMGALLPAITFASDPPGVILEDNDVAFVFSSDVPDHIITAAGEIFSGDVGELFEVTSIRRGFVDGRYVGTTTQSLTKQMATQAGVPGAGYIPDSAELFLGFTSTQSAALGPTVIANLESLPGLTNQWPNGYFVNGTTMQLSHLYEDLLVWYAGPYKKRAAAAFSPAAGAVTPPGTQTVPEGPSNVESEAQVANDVAEFGFTGHSSSMQPESRLSSKTTDNYGNVYSAGTAIPQRADFNTLDNPFSFSSNPRLDRMLPGAAAGLHFVVYVPTNDTFNRVRHAMDGQYPNGVTLGPQVVHGPFNQVLQTTHRQNFLVPPRAHRSFPLAELA